MEERKAKCGCYGMFTGIYWIIGLGLVGAALLGLRYNGGGEWTPSLLAALLATGIAIAYVGLSAVDWLAQRLALGRNPLPDDVEIADRSVARERVAVLKGCAPLTRQLRRLHAEPRRGRAVALQRAVGVEVQRRLVRERRGSRRALKLFVALGGALGARRRLEAQLAREQRQVGRRERRRGGLARVLRRGAARVVGHPGARLGRHELMPVKSTAEAVADYVGKYLRKAAAIEDWMRGAEGMRRPPHARCVRYSQGWTVASQKFAWMEQGRVWRAAVAHAAESVGIVSLEGFRYRYGPRWAFHLADKILGDWARYCDSQEANLPDWARATVLPARTAEPTSTPAPAREPYSISTRVPDPAAALRAPGARR